MTEAKHTPGPWFVTGIRTLYVEARIGGGLVQEIAACGPTHQDGGYGDQQRANARLISAAPEMLEALNLCRQHMYEHASNTPDDAFEKLCAAIAKATGN